MILNKKLSQVSTSKLYILAAIFLVSCSKSSDNDFPELLVGPVVVTEPTFHQNRATSIPGASYRAYWARSGPNDSFGPARIDAGSAVFAFTGTHSLKLIGEDGSELKYIFDREYVREEDQGVVAVFVSDPDNFANEFPDPTQRPNDVIEIYTYLPFNHTGNRRDDIGNIASYLFGDVMELNAPPPQEPLVSGHAIYNLPYTELHIKKEGADPFVLDGEGSMSIDFESGDVSGVVFSNPTSGQLRVEASIVGGRLSGQDFSSEVMVELADPFGEAYEVSNENIQMNGYLSGGGLGTIGGFEGDLTTNSLDGEENWRLGGVFYGEYQ